MAITGNLDYADSNGVKGWVWDPSHPEQSHTIQILVDDKVVDEVISNRFRPDLKFASIGDGSFAFDHHFTDGPIYGYDKAEIMIRVKGGGYLLPGSPVKIQKSTYKYVAMDIVNNCNLRCPFCLYDYAGTKATHRMKKETFQKILGLIPYVPRGQFWLSCLHEPSLHTDFMDFVELIPEAFRKKVFFTSNFARPVKDDYLERLADSNLHHVNISVDSLNPDLYPVLRKGSKLDKFLENLKRLKTIFAHNPRAPKIRFITMVFKSNYDELEDIVKFCSEELGASEHELRYPFKLPHITEEFRENHYLEYEKWFELDEKLKTLPYLTHFELPTDEYRERIFTPIDYYLNRDPNRPLLVPTPPKKPFGIRFSSNGDGRIEDLEEHFHINADIVSNLHNVFSQI